MRAITDCPACQTQFFVTEEQLNQHNGQVRCGHCLHVFDARQQLIELNSQSANDLTTVDDTTADAPLVADDASNDTPAPMPETLESTASSTEAETTATETTDTIVFTADSSPANIDTDSYGIGEAVNNAVISDVQPSNFDDLADKSKLNPNIAAKRSRPWLWLLCALLLLLTATAQMVYFLRNDIAIYYPNTKPYLVQVCKHIACSIELPKKIEFIVIDDSDIKEDVDHAGLMRLTSTLINQAGFNQAYPNLELTLTDVEDKPKLRRIFKPNEYLPEHTDIASGLAAGGEVKVQLAMTTQGVTVAGYRVFVTY